MDKHFAIGNFINDVLSDREIVIKGDGTPLRSYMYATDLVVWLLTILLKGEVNKPYNVGSDKSISILDIALLVNGFQKSNKEVRVLSARNDRIREQYIPDLTRSIETLNLKISVNIKESIRRTLEFQRHPRF